MTAAAAAEAATSQCVGAKSITHMRSYSSQFFTLPFLAAAAATATAVAAVPVCYLNPP